MKTKIIVALCILFAASAVSAAPQQIGLVPIPTLTGVTVTTQVTQYEDQTNFVPAYTYTYTITNPASNTGNIWWIQLDVSAPRSNIFNIPGDFLLPRGGAGQMWFGDLQDETDAIVITNETDPAVQTNVVPFGITAPDGWYGSLTVNQTGGFFASSGSQTINPGQTVTGLTMYSVGIPTIRTMKLAPVWSYVVAGESTQTDAITAKQTELALQDSVQVVAPSYVAAGSDDQFDEMKNDINTMVQLGWIADTSFANTLLTQLQTARNIFDQSGGFQATAAMTTYLNTIQASTSAQRNNDAYQVLLVNAQVMLDTFPPDDEGPVASPRASIITPSSTPIVATVGTTVTVVQQVVDQAANNAPLSGFGTTTYVRSGPDKNLSTQGSVTDSNGQVSLSITGSAPGVDVVAINPSYYPSENGPYQTISIVWVGGPDLVIQEFTPPVVRLGNQGSFQITTTTKNIGVTAIAATNTGYFLSSTYPVDPTNAYFLGSQSVPALAAGASNYVAFQQPVPTDLAPGLYYMLACANYDRSQVERDYDNNCVTIQMVAAAVQTNSPPVCSAATPSQNLLWPPNHKFVRISIDGVTDPNGVTPTITVTSIYQDEPVDDAGSGNTAPDGEGVGTSTAQVRSERSGTAVGGRLYFINFSVADSLGGSCTGQVVVGVPHDQGQHDMPTDNGQRYDSTATH